MAAKFSRQLSICTTQIDEAINILDFNGNRILLTAYFYNPALNGAGLKETGNLRSRCCGLLDGYFYNFILIGVQEQGPLAPICSYSAGDSFASSGSIFRSISGPDEKTSRLHVNLALCWNFGLQDQASAPNAVKSRLNLASQKLSKVGKIFADVFER